MKTNYKFGEVIKHSNVIDYLPEKINSKIIFETVNGGIIFLAIKKGQKLDPHTTPFEVMVNVCEGEIEFTMIDKPHKMAEGDFILMGANVMHSVVAKKDSKLMLVKIRDGKP